MSWRALNTPEGKIPNLGRRCRDLAKECRSKAQSLRNVTARTQMFELAADYERKAKLADALETSLQTPYDQDRPRVSEIFEAFLTPSKAKLQKNT